jgi:hypothetical protein
MATVGYATLDVIPSLRGAQASLEKQAAGPMAAAGRSGGRRFGDAAGVAAGSSFKTRFASGLKGIAAPLGAFAGAAGVVNLFKGAITGASDLEESGSKVGVVFGDAASSVRQFAADASSGLGQSEAQALAATGTFGNLLRAVGLTEEVSADLSTSMVELASDLASFNNTSVDEALEALRSGLVGETEPLKRFGVNMNEATLKAKALELGLSNGKDVLDSNAKAQSAYALIMEQTALAQGDFERTSDGLANQQKILAAQWSEMSTTVGQHLLPAVTGFVSLLNDKGLPALGAAGGFAADAASAFGSLPGPVKTAAAAFVALKVSSAIGLTSLAGSAVQGSVRTMSGLMDTLRLRAIYAGDAFRSASGSGLASTFAGIRAGAAGAAGALRSVTLAVAPIAAITAAVTIWSKYKQGQEEAKARVDELTESLDAQTAAITESTEKSVIKSLVDSGALEAAKELGIELSVVREAALGNAAAQDQLRASLVGYGTAITDAEGNVREYTDAELAHFKAAGLVLSAIFGESAALGQAKTNAKLFAEAERDSAAATEGAETAMRNYAGEIDDAQGKLKKLIAREQERRDALIGDRRDAIALQEVLKSTREEARQGEGGFDIEARGKEGEEARRNITALLDLVDQFNGSTNKVRNQNFVPIREEFIKLAEKMGKTEKQAEKMADQLLRVPKSAPLKFQTEGYRRTMAEIAAIKAAAESAALLVIVPGTGVPGPSPKFPDQDPSGRTNPDFRERPGNNVNYYGPVTYTDDEQGRRDARRRRQRAGSDGVRR